MDIEAKTQSPPHATPNRAPSHLIWLLLAVGCSPETDGRQPSGGLAGDSSGGSEDAETSVPEESETYDDSWIPEDESSGSSDATGMEPPPADCEPPAEPPSVAWAGAREPVVLKVDASTTAVEGLYTGPPSTSFGRWMSVSQNGDAGMSFYESFSGDRTVAVVRGDVADCEESNGEPGIQTSAGPDDMLEFGTDECLAWSTTLRDDVSQTAALAWSRGEWSTEDCRWHGADLWVGRTARLFDRDEAVVSRLDGETGQVEDTIVVADVSRIADLAVDADNNLWIAGNDLELGKLDPTTMEYEPFVDADSLPYASHRALEVDTDGRVWRCTSSGVERLSPESGLMLELPLSFSSVDHCALDLDGQLWIASDWYPSVALVAYDLDTLEVVQQRSLATETEDIAIDGRGQVWRITSFRMDRWDPATDELASVALPSPQGPLRLDTLVTATAPAFEG